MIGKEGVARLDTLVRALALLCHVLLNLADTSIGDASHGFSRDTAQ